MVGHTHHKVVIVQEVLLLEVEHRLKSASNSRWWSLQLHNPITVQSNVAQRKFSSI
jgi:hypothetical protein